VKKVIALSTDKAANPVNLYGATKLASDKLFVAANNMVGKGETRFAVVRYGNVVGTRGSVGPFFEKLIEQGTDHLPITHEDMTRFWISLQAGVDFVMKNFERRRGGQSDLPKIPAARVVEIARVMAPDVPHKIIGSRHGEKLHELVCAADDSHLTIEFHEHYVIRPTIIFTDRGNDFTENRLGEKGQFVPFGFEYNSEANDKFLEGDELKEFDRQAMT